MYIQVIYSYYEICFLSSLLSHKAKVVLEAITTYDYRVSKFKSPQLMYYYSYMI